MKFRKEKTGLYRADHTAPTQLLTLAEFDLRYFLSKDGCRLGQVFIMQYSLNICSFWHCILAFWTRLLNTIINVNN